MKRQAITLELADIFEPLPEPGKKEALPGYWADRMFTLGDQDYVAYRLFSKVLYLKEIALYHLQQALEKYLKAFFMAKKGDLPSSFQHGHDLVKLLQECAKLEGALADRSLEIFCMQLTEYSEHGRYPSEKRLFLGLQRFTEDMDTALDAVRDIARPAACPNQTELVERIIQRDMEWNPDASSGWLKTEARRAAAEAFRLAILTKHEPPPWRRVQRPLPGATAIPHTARAD